MTLNGANIYQKHLEITPGSKAAYPHLYLIPSSLKDESQGLRQEVNLLRMLPHEILEIIHKLCHSVGHPHHLYLGKPVSPSS